MRLQDILFILLRLGLNTSLPDRENLSVLSSLTMDQWKELREMAAEQAVLAIFVDGVQAVLSDRTSSDMVLALNEQTNRMFRYELFSTLLTTESDNKRQISVLKELGTLWANAGCRVMLMKGQAMGTYYPNPLHRATGDVDIYMLDGGYQLGNAEAANAGATVDNHWYKHSQIRYKGEMFENHQYLVHTRDGKRGRQLDSELKTLAASETYGCFPDSDIALPPVMFNALFLTYHAFAHFISEGIRLKHVADWAMFISAEKDNIDWERLYCLCGKFHLRRFVDVMNDIAVHRFGVAPCASMTVGSPYSDRVLESVFNDKDFVFSSGKSGWYNRMHLVRNMFKYRWKYHYIYETSVLRQLWYYVTGYFFHTEEN